MSDTPRLKGPKIYVLADMEGISGIRKPEQVKKEFPPDYAAGCRLMTQEINLVVAALYEHGASDVVVRDTHAAGGQIDVSDMDPRAIYEMSHHVVMPSLDETFAGVILLGHHAKAGTRNGFLDHTMSSDSWFSCSLNGAEVGEIALEAAYAGHFGVPVIAVTGDEETAREARATLGSVECAVVKWGLGRNHAKCLSVAHAHEQIRQAIDRSLASLGTFKAYRPTLPATIEVTFYRSDYADRSLQRTDLERIGARTIRKTISSFDQVFTCW